MVAQIHEGGEDASRRSTVPTGLLLENVTRGDDVEPVRKSRRRAGTSTTAATTSAPADMVIMRDPDTGWINYGAYRVQVARPAASRP